MHDSDLQREKEAVNQQAQALKLRLKRPRERDRRALTSVALQVWAARRDTLSV
jgi:hypothetical protein